VRIGRSIRYSNQYDRCVAEIGVDSYVFDSPHAGPSLRTMAAALLVYLCLWRQTTGSGLAAARLSYGALAEATRAIEENSAARGRPAGSAAVDSGLPLRGSSRPSRLQDYAAMRRESSGSVLNFRVHLYPLGKRGIERCAKQR
jgi:hypothetical protein